MALHLLVGLGTESGLTAVTLAVLLTYGAHALLWALVAALLALPRALSAAARHVIWRAALLGPLATTVATLAASTEWPAPLAVTTFVRDGSAPNLLGAALHPTLPAETSTWLPALGLSLLGVGVLRYVFAALALGRRVADRVRVSNATLLSRLNALQGRMGLARIELSQSENLSSPLVLGRFEICVPAGLLEGLSDAEVDAIFAHELAHIERRDELWFPIAGLIQSVLWIQPLNHRVAARFRESAELACDDRAVELTADPLSLARALLSVAKRAIRQDPGLMLPAMARPANLLLPRIRRLTQGKPGSRSRHRAFTTLGIAGLAIAALSLRVRAAAPPSSSAAPARTGQAALQGDSIENSDTRTAQARDSLAHDNPARDEAFSSTQALAKLLQRDRRIRAELDALGTLPAAARAVREVELEQELRHTQEAAAWTEQRLTHSLQSGALDRNSE